MSLKTRFIQATTAFNTFEKNVPAYYFRRAFHVKEAGAAKLTVAVCGFYELYWNGAKITRGFLSPYISNPNDYIYCDEYEVTLNAGENVIGLMLGNGFQNNPGGYIWDFDQAAFRSAPKVALSLTISTENGAQEVLYTDPQFKIAPSPIRSDDYRFGEHYDANYEIAGWNKIGFDDTGWANALAAEAPNGELRVADVDPIVQEREIRPVAVIPYGDDFIYDFGESNAGVCRLTVNGEKGQKIELRHADSRQEDGDLNIRQIWFPRDNTWERDRKIVHCDTYVCKGTGTEVYQPTFTYHGFRYVKVSGICKEQATEDLLTFLVYHTDLKTRGDFCCSDQTATRLQKMTRQSIISNFHHFPTDCPQREKNGWTADAALSCEAALINFDPERNYREWMRNICKAQHADGSLPGIVPTDGWGFAWGNGPAWDCVLVQIPYFTYIYRGETDMITESAPTFRAYLHYLRTRCDENGLLSIGLGDWCHVGRVTPPKAPLIVTDSIMALDIATKMALLFDAVHMTQDAAEARAEAEKYRAAIRTHLVDFTTMHVQGDCQSSQALALYYGVFDAAERDAAFAVLLDMIRAQEDHIDVGVLGGRVLFHVLSAFGYSDLALHMIVRPDYPSYGNWIARGATTLWENFLPDRVDSMNHHFWGDISAWFTKCLAGIRLNPNQNNVNEVWIQPSFVQSLDRVSAYHLAPAGKIAVTWEKTDDEIQLTVEIPQGISAWAELPCGYRFKNGTAVQEIESGTYQIVCG